MAARFTALRKLRKRQFEQAELALAQANAQWQILQDRKEVLRAQERAIEPPKEGVGRQMGAVVAQRRALQQAIAALDLQIAAAWRHVEAMQAALKQAHIAYEQAKSIESQVLEKLLKQRERRARERLDEIASQRFWRDRPERRGGDA